jgi:hypothetical protein
LEAFALADRALLPSSWAPGIWPSCVGGEPPNPHFRTITLSQGICTITVAGADSRTSKDGFTHEVTGDCTLKVTGDLTIQATGGITIKAGTSLELDAGTSLTLKAATSLTGVLARASASAAAQAPR